MASCLWRGLGEEINGAGENRSDADFTARHARFFECVEESLCLEEPPGWLKNDPISIPGYVMAVVKGHNFDVRATAVFYVIGHAHRPGGRHPGAGVCAGTDLLRYFPCVELRNFILPKITGNIFLASTN